MSFDITECAIPVLWCGNGAIPTTKRGSKKRYYKKGTAHECMKVGFGAGMNKERKKNLPPTSLQQIKYVGEVFEDNFRRSKINNLPALRKWVNGKSAESIKSLLTKVFTTKKGSIDKRAYNSTLMYLNKQTNATLPRCSRISVGN